MDKKYELIESDLYSLYRVRALHDFADVKAGDLGGYVMSEANLSQEGNCWVYDKAMVIRDAMVSDNALVFDNAEVSGHARVFGNAKVCDDAWVSGYARVFDHAKVFGDAKVSDDDQVCSDVKMENTRKDTMTAEDVMRAFDVLSKEHADWNMMFDMHKWDRWQNDKEAYACVYAKIFYGEQDNRRWFMLDLVYTMRKFIAGVTTDKGQRAYSSWVASSADVVLTQLAIKWRTHTVFPAPVDGVIIADVLDVISNKLKEVP